MINIKKSMKNFSYLFNEFRKKTLIAYRSDFSSFSSRNRWRRTGLHFKNLEKFSKFPENPQLVGLIAQPNYLYIRSNSQSIHPFTSIIISSDSWTKILIMDKILIKFSPFLSSQPSLRLFFVRWVGKLEARVIPAIWKISPPSTAWQ